MQLSTRTGLAVLQAVVLAVLVTTAVATVQFQRSLYLRVDQQLRERAETAAVLVAVGDRIAVSELNSTVDGARVVTEDTTVEIGRLPDDPLPPTEGEGLRTVSAGGEQWRVNTVTVDDVPEPGDSAVVELVEPLGDVDARARQLRRRSITLGVVVALAAGGIGWALARRATRPLAELRTDAARIGTGAADRWSVRDDYGTVEVDELAEALNTSLDRLADETKRRQAALASARSFASAASHELRTPLQGAMTQLDLALATPAGDAELLDRARSAREQLDRMASALSAVRALTEIDLVEPTWFAAADLSDLADQAVAALSSAERTSTTIEFRGDDAAPCVAWSDGARLAIENLVRNAVRHGAPTDPELAPRMVVTIDAARCAVVIDDNGPGIPPADRARVLLPFERATTLTPGSGLGLSFAHRVAEAHGGTLTIGDSPDGGTRVDLRLVPGPATD